jgi:hypothetical protein
MIRVNTSFLGITVAALALTLACGDDSSSGELSDGGLEAGADESEADDTTPTSTDDTTTPTDPTDPTEPTDTADDTTDDTTDDTVTETDDTVMPPECEEDVSFVCDGNDRVRIDPCEMGAGEVVETCEGACEFGRCVDCAATAGVRCEDGDVYQLDSCGEVGALLEACTNGCATGACIAENCVPSDDAQCAGNILFSVDSCGNQTNVVDVCDAGCEDGACVGCTDEGETLCYAGDVFPVDSCGRTGDVAEECEVSCAVTSEGGASAASCSDEVCEPTTDTECFRGDLYAVDSCGGILDEVVTDCHNGCDEAGCLACVPAPDGVICLDGDVYDTIGGCDEPSVPAETVKEECDFGCINGACAEEGECVAQGTVCSDGNVHTVDSCEQIGELVEACSEGCAEGECLGSDGGVISPEGGVDGGGVPDSGTPTDDSGTVVVDAGGGDSDAGADAGDAAL